MAEQAPFTIHTVGRPIVCLYAPLSPPLRRAQCKNTQFEATACKLLACLGSRAPRQLGSVHAIYRKKSGHGFWLTPRRLGACRHSRENSAGAPKPGKKREFLPEELKPLELQGFSLQGDLSLQSYTPFILPRRTWRYYLASHYYRALWPKQI